MEIYNNQSSNNTKSTRNCSYCGNPDHVVTDCTNAVNDWAYFQRFEIPLKQGGTHWTIGARRGYNGAVYDHWYRAPSEWSRWFRDCERAVEKIERAKVKAKKKQAGKRSASKCGFCGSTDHNRRHCPSMEQFKQRLLQANRGWRQRFYDKLVGELGLSVGAIVKVGVSKGWREPDEEKIGIIESINWDELSMFCYGLGGNGWRQNIRQEFKQHLRIVVNVENKSYVLRFTDGTQNQYGSVNVQLSDEYGVLADVFSGRNVTFISTVARSETPLDEEWVNQGHEDAMDFLIKKYSMEKLKGWNVHNLLIKVEEANKARILSLSA